MKIWHILPVSALLVGAALLLTGCSLFKSSYTLDTSDSPINELVPNTEITLEAKRENAANMCSFLKTSYEKMQELASADGASSDGLKAEKAVEEEYADRLKELLSLDFSAMEEDEIDSYLLEMTDCITIIREAIDALTLN